MYYSQEVTKKGVNKLTLYLRGDVLFAITCYFLMKVNGIKLKILKLDSLDLKNNLYHSTQNIYIISQKKNESNQAFLEYCSLIRTQDYLGYIIIISQTVSAEQLFSKHICPINLIHFENLTACYKLLNTINTIKKAKSAKF